MADRNQFPKNDSNSISKKSDRNIQNNPVEKPSWNSETQSTPGHKRSSESDRSSSFDADEIETSSSTNKSNRSSDWDPEQEGF